MTSVHSDSNLACGASTVVVGRATYSAAFKDVVFQGIAITGAARAGDINGFKGDTLKNLEFTCRMPRPG